MGVAVGKIKFDVGLARLPSVGNTMGLLLTAGIAVIDGVSVAAGAIAV